jgi:ATP-dependent exoDNAse (exonuclease V) alpha subunit
VRNSPLWRHFSLLRLTEPQRSKDDPSFAILNEAIGVGDIDTFHPQSQIEDPLAAFDHTRSTFLSFVHNGINAFNEKIIQKLFGPSLQLYEAKYFSSQDGLMTTTAVDIMNYHQRNTPPHHLYLAAGLRIMIVRNIAVAQGLSNGTIAEILSLHQTTVRVKLISGSKQGSVATLFKIPFRINRAGIVCNRLQLPIVPAYALTVNKSQGKTLDAVILDCQHSPFNHGQLYVACSRVRTSQNLTFCNVPTAGVQNVVFPELIEDLR